MTFWQKKHLRSKNYETLHFVGDIVQWNFCWFHRGKVKISLCLRQPIILSLKQMPFILLRGNSFFWRQWCSLPLNRSFRWNMFYMLHFCFCLISRSQLEFSDYCEVFSGEDGRGWWDAQKTTWLRIEDRSLAGNATSQWLSLLNPPPARIKNPEAGFLICSLGGFSGARSDARGTRQGQCCRRRLREGGCQPVAQLHAR